MSAAQNTRKNAVAPIISGIAMLTFSHMAHLRIEYMFILYEDMYSFTDSCIKKRHIGAVFLLG